MPQASRPASRAYRADHVGSLLRPPELLEARAAYGEGRISLDQLRAMEDQAVLDALAMQRQAGIGVFSDGELRRGGWMTEMAEAVEGFVPAERVNIAWHGPNASEHPSDAQVVGAKLRQTRRLAAHESAFMKEHAPGPFKVTLPSPSVFMLLGYRPGLTDRFYATRLDLLQELGRITRAEIEALIAEGVPYVQLDAPQYSNYVDARRRENLRAAGIDPDEASEQALAVDRSCLEGLRGRGATIGFHICRGNRQSMWFAEGGYDPIAEKLFTMVPPIVKTAKGLV